MSATATVPMLDPTGQARMIPQDQQQAALTAGAKPAVKILDPQGTARWIPQDQQQAALSAGGKMFQEPSTPAAPTPAAPIDFGANPNGEGTYQMRGPHGPIGVPYSKVHQAQTSGYQFNPHDEVQFMKDYVADPHGKVAHQAYYRALLNPQARMLEGFGGGAMQTVGGVLNILAKHREESLKDQRDYQMGRHGGASPDAHNQPIDDPMVRHLRNGAEWLNSNSEADGVLEHLGGFAESVAELLTPEALGKLAAPAEAVKAAEAAKVAETASLGTGAGSAIAKEGGSAIAKTGELATKGGKVASAADKYARAAEASKVLNKYPNMRKLVALGLATAARGAAEAGGQTYIKSGGDAEAATHAAEFGAAAGAIPLASAGARAGVEKLMPEMRTIEGVEVPIPRENAPKPTPAQTAGAEAYRQTARGAATQHLEAVGAPREFVDKTLNTIHDFTGAGQRLADVNESMYDALDGATGGKFRQLNKDVQKAQKDAFFGGPEAKAHYENKLREMDDLLSTSTNGQVPPERLGAIKQSWRASYMLSDIGNALDRALDGLPGESNVSAAQRGINGNRLKTSIDQVVRRFGVDNVRQILGPGRLENLQAIAQATKTNQGRQAMNRAMQHVAAYMHVGPIGAAAWAGHAAGIGYTQGAMIGAGAVGSAMLTRKVLDAVRSNPNVGRNLLFAIDAGARPERYGPMIAAMIQQYESQGSREQQQQQHDEENNQQ